MKQEKIVHLLTIQNSSNDAEAIVSMMRNAGFAIRSSNIEDEEDLKNALEQQSWDLLVASVQTENFSASQALEIIKQLGKDVPVIVTTSNFDAQLSIELMNLDARDVVPGDEQELLLLVISRELADLEQRRELRSTRSMYQESEKRNRTLLDSSRDAIAYIHEGMHIYSNSAYLEAFGYVDAGDIEGIPIMDMIAPENQGHFKEILIGLGKGINPEKQVEFTGMREDEKSFKALMEFTSASIDGEPCTQVVIRTKSANENDELQREIDILRRQDLLTGLFNRNYFQQKIEEIVAKTINNEVGQNYALLYVELDDFKAIAENVGIAASDLVLTDVASVIRDHFGDQDIVARYAGSIFTILTNEADTQNILQKAQSIHRSIADHIFAIEGRSINCTCSIGICQITETSPEAKTLITQADMACKTARSNSDNGIHMHSVADEQASNLKDQEWIKRIRFAIENDRFRLLYQPIVSLHAEPGERYEILLRMLDENGNEVVPIDFLGIAERAGLTTDIDRWVIKQSVKVLTTKRNLNTQIQFFIKLSYDSIKNQALLIWISKLLKAARLHGSCLIFEISESSALSALKETKLFANGLKQLHCQFAIDHVGSETESFNYLKHLEAKFLKIDGSHIKDLAASENSQNIVKAIAVAARSQEKLIIAEHVQEANSLALLWQFGVNFIQGYYLQHPDPAMTYDFSGESE